MIQLRSLNIDKLLTAVAAVFILIISITIVNTPPADGRELAIYDNYPFYFWLLFITSGGCGISILIHQALSINKSRWWLAGFGIVLITNCIFLGLPFFHGYAFFPTGDAMTHVGSIKDIIQTGHIGEENIYPGVHLLGASILKVTELGLQEMANLLFVFWYILYFLSLYLLSTALTSRRGLVLLVIAIASPLMFSRYLVTIHPSYLSLFMVPSVLYFLHLRVNLPTRKVAITLAVMISSSAIVLVHPQTTLFIIVFLLALCVFKSIYKSFANRHGKVVEEWMGLSITYTLPILLFIIFYLWYFGNEFTYIENNVRTTYEFLISPEGSSPVSMQISELSHAGLTLWQTIKLFIYRYGVVFVYGLFAAIATIWMWKNTYKKKHILDSVSLIYTMMFIVAIGFTILSLTARIGEIAPVRFSRFFLLLAPLVIAWMVYHFLNRRGMGQVNFIYSSIKRRMFIGFVTVLLFVTSGLSFFNVYGSPLTARWNSQIAGMEIAGAEWFLDHRVSGVDIIVARVEVGRFEDFIYGAGGLPFGRYGLRLPYSQSLAPSHFDYETSASISELVDSEDTYLVTNELGRINDLYVPEGSRHRFEQYHDKDFARLRTDPAVSQIYHGAEFEVWRIY